MSITQERKAIAEKNRVILVKKALAEARETRPEHEQELIKTKQALGRAQEQIKALKVEIKDLKKPAAKKEPDKPKA